MSDRYFFLNPECILVSNARNAAIYNVRSGDIIALNVDINKILTLTDKGFAIDAVARVLEENVHWVRKVLNDVAARNLGKYYTKRVYIERYKKVEYLFEEVSPGSPVISKCYIELPSDCDLDCSFCRLPKLYPCNMCSYSCDTTLSKDYLSSLHAFLNRIFKLQCKSLIFGGGDPLNIQGDLFSLIRFCRRNGFSGQMYVITNGKHLDDMQIKVFKRYKVHPIIPFTGTYNTNFLTKDELASLTKTFRLLGIELTVTLVFIDDNASEAQKLRDVVKNLDVKNIRQTAVVYEDKNKARECIEALGKQMLRTTMEVFYHNKKYHPCLHGTLAVSTSGDLLPCPFLKDEALGNIADPHIVDEVFESRLIDKYWRMSLSQIENCKTCAFRYGCLDCRAVEKQLSGDLYGKVLCPHNV